ncbi:SRPBCC domain-containing protein [Hoyosella rhizosphaerae]|uniref:Activator of Hsp90 ATPase homologue 1/2-like C-terminal domain-containing protein n=1 Tax=Hoyosella rhizosphaerae TaxID=1755582 RepID=A0A916X8N9_9ACTN|nr:SRPBCC family protein [Hoyosella rhizosphaerae]MBN4926997.1 SRPBCC domain-containing protein [Hoyosella rhizosphaerae]GGC54858.1 hypothetical protein GCM10011410_04050 [Hoyosella rhizosphaerae]
MPVTSVTRDTEALTLTVVAEFSAPLRRLWDAYLDPRQLERFWGPPGYPATFTRHDGSPNGTSAYYMTGPNDERYHGYWKWVAVTPEKSFEVVDGFANPDGTPHDELPTSRTAFTFETVDNGSRVTTVTTFASLEDLEKLLEMGMEEGLQEAMGQIDDVLADLTSFAHDRATASQILNDTQVRISRVIRGSVDDVWRAHNDAELIRRWLLGPDGWTMPVCELATEVGDSYRYEWAPEGGGEGGFGFEGELLENTPPYRAVTTERMIGMEGEGTINELTLTPVEGGTLLSLVITYPTTELRDIVLGTGMTDGMETSYQRLEREVLAPAGL